MSTLTRVFTTPIPDPNRFAPSLVALLLLLPACATPQGERDDYRWTRFVAVDGQPEPVPEEWVSTPEGKFAHSLRIPNPVPKDSGYRSSMSSEEYFQHLCKTEAGEFIFRRIEGVEGFYFARPVHRPTDDELLHSYRLEAPEIQRSFQQFPSKPEARAERLVSPPWRKYLFVEEPTLQGSGFYRLSGFKQGVNPMQRELVDKLRSRYAITWRGVHRHRDRESGIGGSEWVVYEIDTRSVLAVFRNFAYSGHTRNTKDGIWWLNARNCTQDRSVSSMRFYDLYAKVLQPMVASGILGSE